MSLIRRSSILIVALVLIFSFGAAQTEVITLMHVNDSHSTLSTIGPRGADLKGSLGGIARVATLVNIERLTNRNLLLLHAGDLFVGDMFFNKYFGVPELKALQLLGFDAMAVGNHEFDLTPDVLLQSLETAFPHGEFPLLSANLNLSDDAVAGLRKHIHPYIIKRIGSVKVGIFGLTTPATNLLSQPSPAVVDEDFPSAAAASVQALKAEGCQLIICLSHLGVQLDQVLAQNVPGINVIVGGHDHFLFEKPIEVMNPAGEKTWIVQANAFYLNMGKMTITVQNGKVKSMQYKMLKIDSSIPEAPLVAATVQLLIKGIENTYGQPFYSKQVAYAKSFFEEVATDLTKPGSKDTPVGNLVTDAFRAVTNTDIAIEVGGSTAQPLYQGPLVAADFFRMLGYGFNTVNGLGWRLATFKMSGAALMAGLETGVADFAGNYDEYLVQSSGLKYRYDPKLPPTQRVVYAEVNGQPVTAGGVYTVTANESVPMIIGMLGIEFTELNVLPTTEFEAVLGYAAARQTLKPKVEGRVVCGSVPAAPRIFASVGTAIAIQGANVCSEFALEQNYPNPFNPSTTIAYTLATPGAVSLKIFNMLGQEVAALVSGEQAAGPHKVVWNATQRPSGIYLMRLEAGNNVAARKLQLVK